MAFSFSVHGILFLIAYKRLSSIFTIHHVFTDLYEAFYLMAFYFFLERFIQNLPILVQDT